MILYGAEDEITKPFRKRPLEGITSKCKGQRVTVQHGEGYIVFLIHNWVLNHYFLLLPIIKKKNAVSCFYLKFIDKQIKSAYIILWDNLH